MFSPRCAAPVLVLACLAAGCRMGGGEENPPPATAPSTAPAPAPTPSPAPPPTTGAMAVQIAGLPSGLEAHVTVTGGGMTRFVTATRTLADLAPGTYTVAAEPVLTGQSLMAPTAATQAIQVASAQTAAVTVSYNVQEALAIRLEDTTWTGLDQPIFLASPPGDTRRVFIAERTGRIRVVQSGTLLATPFLDISGRVSTSGERGMLSFAFHPQHAANRWVFVHFTNLAGEVTVERFAASAANPNVADATSTPVIRIAHAQFDNHNGGVVAFGPDGMLYLSTGDGGGGGDPQMNAQNPNRLLGKMLRIDVGTLPYTIPPTNPLASEIWGIGLRNPWRWSFDAQTDRLYIADVGQNRYEEVDVVRPDAPAPGFAVNFGWPLTEGSRCFPDDQATCSTAGQTLPLLEYDHDTGACAITGGYVYRGAAIPALQGRYFYSDYCSGFVRSFRFTHDQAIERIDWNTPDVGRVISFGEDASRELYVLTASNRIYRVARQ
jgi:glucose/arabinose dehydrogenase